jgi:hypothetical protein
MAAYRAMPRGSYEFLSPAKDQEATLRALKLDGKNLFYMATPSFLEKTMKIKAETITDLTTGKTISAKNGTITVALSPCDLRAFSSREMPGFVEIKTETDKFFEKNLAMVKDKIKVAEKSGISTARAKADVKNIKKLVLDKKFDSAADLLINSLEIKKIYTQLVNNGKGKGWTWCYLGPFPLSTQKGYFVTSGVNKFETEFIKEDMPPDFERTYSNFNDEPVKWEKFVTKPGKINFGNIYPWEADYTVSYACIGIESSKGQKATILSGSSDNIKIWLNGKKVHNMKRGSRDARLGQDKIDVTLKKGYNLIMFKVHNYINLYQIMLKVVPQERGTVKIVPPKGRK